MPVTPTDAHGPAQLVTPGSGWLVPSDNQNALAETLLTAASDTQERHKRGNHAHQHSHSNHGWPLIASHTVNIYKQLTNHPPKQPPAHT